MLGIAVPAPISPIGQPVSLRRLTTPSNAPRSAPTRPLGPPRRADRARSIAPGDIGQEFACAPAAPSAPAAPATPAMPRPDPGARPGRLRSQEPYGRSDRRSYPPWMPWCITTLYNVHNERNTCASSPPWCIIRRQCSFRSSPSPSPSVGGPARRLGPEARRSSRRTAGPGQGSEGRDTKGWCRGLLVSRRAIRGDRHWRHREC